MPTNFIKERLMEPNTKGRNPRSSAHLTVTKYDYDIQNIETIDKRQTIKNIQQRDQKKSLKIPITLLLGVRPLSHLLLLLFLYRTHNSILTRLRIQIPRLISGYWHTLIQ